MIRVCLTRNFARLSVGLSAKLEADRRQGGTRRNKEPEQ